MSDSGDSGGYGRFLTWFYAFIPRRISNRVVIWVMQFMRSIQRHGSIFAAGHYNSNARLIAERAEAEAEGSPERQKSPFIEDQKQLKDIYIGMSTMDKAGCEVIAVYNILKALGIGGHGLAELIEGFEQDGIIHNGLYGVAVGAVRDKLRSLGLNVKMTVKKDRMAELLATSAASILTMYNNKSTIGEQVHTVCITRQEDVASAGYYIHNMYGDGSVLGPYKDWDHITGTLRGGHTGPIALIGVTDDKYKAGKDKNV